MLHPNGQKYESTATFSSANSRIPMEPLLKCLASVIGIIGEAVTGFDSNWNYDNIMNNLQHMLMFFFYFMNSVSDFAVFYKIKHVPPRVDYVFALLAIFTPHAIWPYWPIGATCRNCPNGNILHYFKTI